MRKLKIPGTWKFIAGESWVMSEQLREIKKLLWFVVYEVSLDCKIPRLVSPSGSFWEGEEKIALIIALLKNQKEQKTRGGKI